METPRAGDSARNLILCHDGTNNTLTGGIEDTNVLLLYAYLRKHTAGTNTLLFYDPGVGSPDSAPPTDLTDLIKRRVQRITGLASGRGVYENIAEGYRFIMQHWRGPEDRIFSFGFSRGAFTARAVVGMVNLFGVLRPEHEALLPTLVRIYFSQPPLDQQAYGRNSLKRAFAQKLHVWLARPDKPASEPVGTSEEAAQVTRNELAQEVRLNFSTYPVAVHWVGVWDTVESVGLPVLFSRDNPSTATFHDKPNFRNVRHAVSLDEHRFPFLPRLYDSPSELTTDDGRTIKQLWFPGVHCDIGGSYHALEAGLADASLVWMLNEAAPELGLPKLAKLPASGSFPYDDLGMPRRMPFPSSVPKRHDALWDTPWWALAGMTLREMQTRRVWTNGEERNAEDMRKRTGERPTVGVAVDVRAPGPLYEDGPSVWDQRRKAWPALFAALIAVAALFLGGRNLPPADPQQAGPAGLSGAPAAACNFALQQLATISPVEVSAKWVSPDCGTAPPGGLRNATVWKRTMDYAPAWALIWDLVFILALGYLIARVASRGFTYLAGFRYPAQSKPWWRFVGFLPLFAIGADVSENIATLAAIALSAMHVAWLSTLLLFVVGILSIAKFIAYAGCFAVFLPLRGLIAITPGSRIGKVGRGAAKHALSRPVAAG